MSELPVPAPAEIRRSESAISDRREPVINHDGVARLKAAFVRQAGEVGLRPGQMKRVVNKMVAEIVAPRVEEGEPLPENILREQREIDASDEETRLIHGALQRVFNDDDNLRHPTQDPIDIDDEAVATLFGPLRELRSRLSKYIQFPEEVAEPPAQPQNGERADAPGEEPAAEPIVAEQGAASPVAQPRVPLLISENFTNDETPTVEFAAIKDGEPAGLPEATGEVRPPLLISENFPEEPSVPDSVDPDTAGQKKN